MSFLGPVTTLDGKMVRPHDLDLCDHARPGSVSAQITRGDAEALALRDGDTVYVRATRVPPLPSDIVRPGRGGAEEDRSTLTSA